MADYNINAVTRRKVFTGSAGTGPYAFTFEILDDDDLAVYFNTTKLTKTTDYNVTINANGTGSVTLVVNVGGNVPETPDSNDTVIVVGARDIERTTDFVTAGDLLASSLNEQLDSLTIFDQQLAEEGERTMRAPVFDPALVADGGTLDMTLPAKADRAGKYLAFNSSTGNPEVGPTVSDVTTVSAAAADIALLADIQDGTTATNAITTTAGISANVTTVAGISSNVTTVAGISSNVTAVAGNASNINAVAADATDIGAVAGKTTEIGRLGTADAVADMNTLGTAAIVADMDALADISSDITAVADIASDVSAVEDIAANVTTVAGVSANVTTVAGSIGNVNTAAGSIANINTTAGSIANVNTTAANITDVNTFAVRYRIGSSDPTSSLDAGDLFFNTTSNTLKVYNGSAWVSIDADTDVLVAVSSNDTTAGYLNGKLTAGTNVTLTEGSDGGNETLSIAAATELSGDTTPQLGGDLQSNGNDILFADSDKCIFGAGSDLQIYHDGSHSYIKDDGGTGNLRIWASNLEMGKGNGAESYIQAASNGAVDLYYDGSKKLATTNTGVDVTGTVTADGVTVTGTNANLVLGTSGSNVTFNRNGDNYISASGGASSNIILDPQNRLAVNTGGSERLRVTSGGNLNVGKTADGIGTAGLALRGDVDIAQFTRSGGEPLELNRLSNDGALIIFYQDGTQEGNISVSGSTVSYNGGHLARWSQATDGNRINGLVKGTVMTNLDQMAVWHHEAQAATYYEEGDELPEGVSVGDEKTPAVDAYDEDNEQLNCMAVSSVEGDANVAGVFVNYDDDDTDHTADMNIAMTGDMVIRIAQGTTVARGDLLMSAGDGTAKPQRDDIVRSKTIAKVTSTTVSHTYDDGTFLVPCVLMAC